MRDAMYVYMHGTSIVLTIALAFINNTSQTINSTAVSTTPLINDFSNITIGIERNMCLGACPVYSLEIFGNGTVVYIGERFVNVTGTQISNISKDKVKELVEEFYNIDYFSLNDTYDKIVKTDQPTVTTSINISGAFRSIFDNLGALAPEGLRTLENEIDEIANSSKWIKPYVHPQGEPIR
jgi:Domain of unknown function (DUF6438)